ncbi:hypothetical protein JCM6882_000598 [Rhodosporidiobolus microsporus]
MRFSLPTKAMFELMVETYRAGLQRKKSSVFKSYSQIDAIRYTLQNPSDTSRESAQWRHSIRKQFRLDARDRSVVLSIEGGKPLLPEEEVYKVLCEVHVHGGRDRTFNALKALWSGVPKEVVAAFVKECPGCMAQRKTTGASKGGKGNGPKKNKNKSAAAVKASPSPSSSTARSSPSPSLSTPPPTTPKRTTTTPGPLRALREREASPFSPNEAHPSTPVRASIPVGGGNAYPWVLPSASLASSNLAAISAPPSAAAAAAGLGSPFPSSPSGSFTYSSFSLTVSSAYDIPVTATPTSYDIPVPDAVYPLSAASSSFYDFSATPAGAFPSPTPFDLDLNTYMAIDPAFTFGTSSGADFSFTAFAVPSAAPSAASQEPSSPSPSLTPPSTPSSASSTSSSAYTPPSSCAGLDTPISYDDLPLSLPGFLPTFDSLNSQFEPSTSLIPAWAQDVEMNFQVEAALSTSNGTKRGRDESAEEGAFWRPGAEEDGQKRSRRRLI